MLRYTAERKLTLSFATVAEVGWALYALYFIVYLACVEMGIYWVHRKLHTVKFLYNHVHLMHHKYNKPEEVWYSLSRCYTALLCIFVRMYTPWYTRLYSHVQTLTQSRKDSDTRNCEGLGVVFVI